MHLSSSDIPPTAIRDIPVQYLLLHTHIVLRLWNIFQYMLFIKKATSIRTFYHKDLISWKSIIIKKNFSNRKCNIVQKCTWFWAHNAVLRFPTILHWLDLPQENSSSWQNLVENLHQDKLKHQNCWQFIHSFSKPFFSFFHVWCNGVQSLDRSVEKNPEAHGSKEFQNR